MPLRSLPASDELYRLIVENSSEAIVVLDEAGAFLYVSAGHDCRLGHEPAELVGGNIRALVHPDDLAAAEGLLQRAAGGERVRFRELRVRQRGGRWLSLEGVVAAVEAGAGAKLLLLTARDVTQRRRHERAEREFVANAAHELLTPLAAITAVIDVLQTGAKDVPAARDAFLTDLEHEVDRLGRLAYALLLLARVQATDEALLLRPVELSPLLHEIAAGVPPRPKVEVDVVCPAELAVLAERDLLERALANLAENALAHTAWGCIVLVARATGSGTVELEVRDTGSGMPPEERERAFERFYRVGARGGDGFGLGLAIVREAARALNGSVAIESEPGIGTVVRLTLPAAVPAEAVVA